MPNREYVLMSSPVVQGWNVSRVAGEVYLPGIQAGQTAYATGTGYWLGVDAGIPKFSIGNSVDFFRWTGTGIQLDGTFQISSTSFFKFTTAVRFTNNNDYNVLVLDNVANVVCGHEAIATTATNGFLYVPSCAGVPTGTPTTYLGRVPIIVDTTNNRLYFYSSGAWRNAGP